MYAYAAVVEEVIDGDTVELRVDLGFRISFRERFRLNRINAPELRGESRELGKKAKEWLHEKLHGKSIEVKTIKDRKEKYGRYLAEIYVDGRCVNDLMVHEGMAEYAQY